MTKDAIKSILCSAVQGALWCFLVKWAMKEMV